MGVKTAGQRTCGGGHTEACIVDHRSTFSGDFGCPRLAPTRRGRRRFVGTCMLCDWMTWPAAWSGRFLRPSKLGAVGRIVRERFGPPNGGLWVRGSPPRASLSLLLWLGSLLSKMPTVGPGGRRKTESKGRFLHTCIRRMRFGGGRGWLSLRALGPVRGQDCPLIGKRRLPSKSWLPR